MNLTCAQCQQSAPQKGSYMSPEGETLCRSCYLLGDTIAQVERSRVGVTGNVCDLRALKR